MILVHGLLPLKFSSAGMGMQVVRHRMQDKLQSSFYVYQRWLFYDEVNKLNYCSHFKWKQKEMDHNKEENDDKCLNFIKS